MEASSSGPEAGATSTALWAGLCSSRHRSWTRSSTYARRSAICRGRASPEKETRTWRLLEAVPDPLLVIDADAVTEVMHAQAVVLLPRGTDSSNKCSLLTP